MKRGNFIRFNEEFLKGGEKMDGFLTLAGQLFLILCIQSVLEAMVTKWQNNYMLKPIELGCYLASLVVVLRFMERYLFDILRSISKFF